MGDAGESVTGGVRSQQIFCAAGNLLVIFTAASATLAKTMPSPSLRNPASSRWRLESWVIGVALAAVVWFYFWTVASAGGFEPANDADYYNLLVRGYRKGHLYLDQAPAPALLALSNPYDPAQNGPYRLPDATYFRGHYYLYFGPTPAVVLMLPYALLSGREMPTGAAVFLFCTLGFLTASGLWLAIRRRYFPASAWWSGAMGVLMLGLATHVLALARRPEQWELPIAAGFAFGMLALAAMYAAVHARTTRASALACGAAGLCIGLAASSRPPCLFGAAMLLAPLWLGWRERKSGRTWWWGRLAAAVGLGLCVAAMLVHNYARFGNALEFGQNYQLTSSQELKNRHFGLDYMAHNLAVYYFGPVSWSWEFPFVAAQTPTSTIPGHAGSEEMAGLGVTLPFLWLALAVPLAWRGRADDERRKLRAVVGAIAGLYLGVGLLLSAFFSTTERYVTDFAPALALLAACGWLGLEHWAQQKRWRAFVMPAALATSLATAGVGVLLSFDYHGRKLSRENPEAWGKLARASHDVLSQVGWWTGQFNGPRVLKVRFVPRPAGTIETFWRATDARADERIVIEHVTEREVRFGYARGVAAVRWGRLLTWTPEHTHTVEVQLPSLYGAPRGFMRGVRRTEEFRERSSATVWFSGGRALSEIVGPVADGITPGGAVGENFSGEVRSVGGRLFRADEIPLVGRELSEPRGGVLRLRVMLPTKLEPAGEPLFATGVLYGSDLFYVRDAGDGAVAFHFDHFAKEHLASKPLRLAPGSEHVIEITLPSCPANETFSGAATGEVTLRVDGEEVLRGRSECHAFAAGEERVGYNPFGTTCAREFRGWLLEARWTGTAKP